MMKYINGAPNAPQAIGPYSQATVFGQHVFLSGQVPINPDTAKIVEGGVEEQTEQVMQNLQSVLAHMKLDFSNVAKATIFLTDLGNFAKVNEIYGKWLGDLRPARATIQVAALPLGAEVEIEMYAFLPEL